MFCLRKYGFTRAVLVPVLGVLCCQLASAEALHSWKREPQQPNQSISNPQVVAAQFQAKPAAPSVSNPSHSTPSLSNPSHLIANDHRLLPSRAKSRGGAAGQQPVGPKRRAGVLSMPQIESFTTAGAGLAIVVGLFLVCMWLLRKSGPKPTSPLPGEAFAVLGRIPLAARNFAHLLQVGNKLVLVAVTPDGVSPITEVTDPMEVQRLLGMCLRNHKQSTTAEFHSVLESLAKEPAKGFLGNEASTSYARQS